ncbi:hypothetical protein L2E81_13665 [Planktothrix agardhii 1033]|nr:hypothetical protein [Planktothrix agardhii 1033]
MTPINTASSLPVYLPESNPANPNSIPIPVPPPESSRLPPQPAPRRVVGPRFRFPPVPNPAKPPKQLLNRPKLNRLP